MPFLALGGLGIWMALRSITGPAPYLGWLEVGREAPLIVLAWVLASRDDPGDRARLLAGILGAFGVVSFFGVLEVLDPPPSPGSWVDGGRYTHLVSRAASVFSNPNLFGLFLAGLLPLFLHRFLHASFPGHAGWGALVAVSGGFLIRTHSRAAWLGAAGGVALLMLAAWRRGRTGDPAWRRRLVTISLLVTPLVLIQVAAVGERIGASLESNSVGVNQRRELYRGVLALCGVHPLAGAGTNTFELVFPRHRTVGGYYPKEAHSLPLQLVAELGLVGLVAGGAFLLGVLASGLGSGGSRDGEAAGLAGFLGACLLISPGRYLFFKGMLYLLAVLAVGPPGVAARPPGRAGRALLVLALLPTVHLWGAMLLVGAGRALGRPEWLDRAAVLIPFADDLTYLRAVARQERGDLAGSMALLEEARRRNPAQGRYDLDLGQAWLELRDLDRARDHLDRARGLDPRSEEILLALAQLEVLDRRPRIAIDLLESALATNEQYLVLNPDTYPRIVDLLLALRNAYGPAGRVRELRALRDRIRAPPGDPAR